MKRFELRDDLCTGLMDVDEDHRELLGLGERIVKPSFMDSDGKTVEEALSFLDDYVLYHFAAEEYAMSEADYPTLESHSRTHRKFQQKISGYVKTGREEGISKELLLKISFTVEDWLTEHILISDHEFAKFLKRKSIPSIRLPGVLKLKEVGKLPKDFNEGIAADR